MYEEKSPINTHTPTKEHTVTKCATYVAISCSRAIIISPPITLPALGTSWNSVTGYKSPWPGSRLVQYKAFVARLARVAVAGIPYHVTHRATAIRTFFSRLPQFGNTVHESGRTSKGKRDLYPFPHFSRTGPYRYDSHPRAPVPKFTRVIRPSALSSKRLVVPATSLSR